MIRQHVDAGSQRHGIVSRMPWEKHRTLSLTYS